MLPPKRATQRAYSVTHLALEYTSVSGNLTPGEGQGSRHAVYVPAPHRRQNLGHASEPLRVEGGGLRRIGQPDLPILSHESLRHQVGEEDALQDRQPYQRSRRLPASLRLERLRPDRCLKRHAALRRVPSVHLWYPQGELLQLPQTSGGLGGEIHVAPLSDVRGELAHGRHRV